MKKKSIIINALLVLTIILIFTNEEPVQAFDIDGNQLCSVRPIVENGCTLVPMRVIFENFGATVNYDANTKTIYATSNDNNTQITLTINSQIAYINGNPFYLTATPKEVNGTTLVPVRFVSEALGAKVNWYSSTGTIVITDKNSNTISFELRDYVGKWRCSAFIFEDETISAAEYKIYSSLDLKADGTLIYKFDGKTYKGYWKETSYGIYMGTDLYYENGYLVFHDVNCDMVFYKSNY